MNKTTSGQEAATNPLPLSCVDCALGSCGGKEGMYPSFCLTANLDQESLADAIAAYQGEEAKRLVCAAAQAAAMPSMKPGSQGSLPLNRVENTIFFARSLGAKKVGVATCLSLLKESRILARILRNQGFQVFGVCCKVGAQDREVLALGPEAAEWGFGLHICNPLLQAKLLNQAGTELNIVMGLCVGHDSLFYRHSQAPVTTLITKDRALQHNPAQALYGIQGEYSYLLDGAEAEGPNP